MNKQTRERRRHRDGRWIDDVVVDEGAEVRVPAMLMDGRPKGWVSPLTDAQVKLLDQHKTGFRTIDQVTDRTGLSDLKTARDGARSAREDYLRDLNSAWKTDARRKRDDPDDDPDDPDDPAEDALDREFGADRARAIRAREAYERRLRDAWRTPAPSLAAHPGKLATELRRPNADTAERHASASGPGPAATLSPGGVPDPDDPQKRRDAAWAEYSNSLSQAWKNGASRNAGPGPSVVGAGPSWKGPAA
jgi:hypothetical protein